MTLSPPSSSESPAIALRTKLIRRHLVEGWGTLTLFVLLGASLEVLLAFKIGFYTRADQTTFRLMWRLAHGHGTLMGLLHFAFAFTLNRLERDDFPQPAGLYSGCLTGATLLIPGGFFLAAQGSAEGDPGVAIALVPVGAVLLLFVTGSMTRKLALRPRNK